MSRPESGAIFDTASAVLAAVTGMPRSGPQPNRTGHLSPAALSITAQPYEAAYSPIVLAGTVRILESAMVLLVGFAVYFCYVVPTQGVSWHYFVAIPAIALLAMLVFQAADIYQIQAFRGHEKQYMRLAAAWSVVFLVAICASFFAKIGDQFSRAWLGSFYVIGLFALIAFRRGLFLLVRRWTREGRLDRRTVVVGTDTDGETLIQSLATQRDSDVRVIGVFDDRGDERAAPTCAGVPKLGTVDDLVEFARRTRVDLVIFSLPISAENRILQMLKKLWVLPVDIRLSAHTNKLRYRPRSYSYVGNVPVLDVFDKPIADWDVVMKWLFDKIVGSLALIVTAPIMLLVAIAIKLDSRGPVLFKQKRYGFNNELVEIYKFRSMYADQTDAGAEQARHPGRSAGDAGRPVHPQDQPRRTAAAYSMSCSPATCRSSARARTRCRPRPRTGSITKRWTAISPATASSPASPAGRRSTAGAARPTARKKSSAASSTTCTTSRTGRSCSTSTSSCRRRSR